MKIRENRFLAVWKMERLICRLLAAWCWVTVYILLQGEGADFTELKFAQDYSLMTVGLWTLNGFVLFSPIAILCHPLHSDSWFLLSGASTCVWLWMYKLPSNDNKALIWLGTAVVFSLFVLYCVHANKELFRHRRLPRWVAVLIAVVAAGGSCAVIAVITCLRYKTFSSPNFDLGLFVNMFHNMRETGLPMITSERDRLLSHFAVHISPIYYLLLPFYYLFPSPLTLQIGQAVALMLGIVPVLLLAKHFKLSTVATIGVSLLYAFYPVLTTGCFYDIHENCFLSLFLLLTFYFYEAKKPIPMLFSAICVLGVKEDAAILMIVFGIYVLLSRKDWLNGLLILLLSGGWFLCAGYLMEVYGLGMMTDRTFGNLIFRSEDGILGVIKTAILNPGYLLTQLFTTSGSNWDKIVYFCQLFLPLGMLPFCTKKASRWLLIAPVLINLLTYYPYQYNPGFQYHFGIAAFLIYAAVQNLAELSDGWKRSLLGVAVACCFTMYVANVVPTLSSYHTRWEEGKEGYLRMEEILDTVPKDASVNCSTFLLAHLADRDVIYEEYYHGNKPDVDYVVLDARYSDWKKVASAYTAQGYEITFSEPGKIVILQKTAET